MQQTTGTSSRNAHALINQAAKAAEGSFNTIVADLNRVRDAATKLQNFLYKKYRPDENVSNKGDLSLRNLTNLSAELNEVVRKLKAIDLR